MSLLNTVKGIVKANVNSVKQVYRLYKSGKFLEAPEDIGDCNFKLGSVPFGINVKLVKFDQIFAAQGLMNIPCAYVVGTGYSAVIFVNSAWQQAERSVKCAILAHELGHLKLGHLNDAKASWLNNIGRMFGFQASIDNELAADMVALEAGHDVGLHNCLIKLLIHAENNHLPTKEIDARLNQIHRYKDSIREKSLISRIKSLFN